MIDKLSSVHPNAEIGDNVIISAFSTVEDDVVIGDNTWIGSNVTIMKGSRIGSNCKIFPGAVIGADPQDLKFKGEYTTAEVGDYTTIREYVTINRGTIDKNTTKVGKHCLIMAYVHIAHDCIIGDHCVMANYTGLSGHNVLEDWVILEGMVGTQQFIRIGAHSFVAGGTLIRKNVPPFVRAAREPVSYIGINSVGLKRRGFDPDVIAQIETMYKILYIQNRNLQTGLDIVKETIADIPEKQQIIEFIENSERGVMRGNF